MSGKYSHDRDSRRHSDSRSDSRRRSSPSRHRSRRSPSPGPSRSSPRPRDPRNLPESFGRIQDAARQDDDMNILQRMKNSYENSPLANLYLCVKEKKKVKIWTRNYKEVRGVMTGYIIAFDKHWNLILRDVDEVFLKNKKNKTPFLREVAPNESFQDMPIKKPKEKKPEEKKENNSDNKVSASENEGGESGEKKSEKKKKKKKKSKTISEKRVVEKLFVRGDNVVMICPVMEEVSIEEGEDDTQNSD